MINHRHNKSCATTALTHPLPPSTPLTQFASGEGGSLNWEEGLFSARGLFLIALIHFVLLAPTNSHAHGPFDNSVHATLRADGLEVSVALGGEAAVEILNRASPKKPVSLGGMGLKTLPNELAVFFIEIKSGATTLVANQFTVVGDGLEYTFTATYPSPVDATLAFRAPYFAMLEQMKLGTLVLSDEAGRQMGSGLFTKTNTAVELTVPRPSPAVASTEMATPQSATTAAIAPATPAVVATNTSASPNRSSFSLILMIGLPALGGVWLMQRLLSKPAQQG